MQCSYELKHVHGNIILKILIIFMMTYVECTSRNSIGKLKNTKNVLS
jgi:hypothetical protein